MDYTSSGFAGQLLAKSVLRVIAMAQAGLAFLHYGFLDWISKESVPFTADGEYLEGWAALKNVIRESPTVATGSVTALGTNGAILPASTLVQTSDGTQYSVNADIVISGSSGNGSITAVVAGLGGNADLGVPLTAVNTVTGITALATISALVGGNNVESDSALRNRMLIAYQNPPQGGAASDYINWCLATPGVTRAWCLPNGEGAGSVVLYPMFDISEAANNGFPVGTNGGASAETRITAATGDQLTVANYVYPLRPVTVLVYVAAPAPFPINITISNLMPGGSAILAAIPIAITNAFVLVGSPLGSTIYQSTISGAIEAVTGVVDFVVVSPASTTAIPVGSLPTLGTVTYI